MLLLNCFQVYFVDRDSHLYTHNKRCEFWIQGSGNGVLESPKHTLPPNTTCYYHLQGNIVCLTLIE